MEKREHSPLQQQKQQERFHMQLISEGQSCGLGRRRDSRAVGPVWAIGNDKHENTKTHPPRHEPPTPTTTRYRRRPQVKESHPSPEASMQSLSPWIRRQTPLLRCNIPAIVTQRATTWNGKWCGLGSYEMGDKLAPDVYKVPSSSPTYCSFPCTQSTRVTTAASTPQARGVPIHT